MGKILFVIPARGGSKGIPGKNIKPLCGKPLIGYSIEVAREFADDDDICLSTDDVSKAMSLYSPDIDMVVTVKEAATNPYYNAFEEDENGFLHISKGDGHFTRRQDAPKVWEYNGAVYVINVASLRQMTLGEMPRRRLCEMDATHSVDLDTPIDWLIA